MRLALGNDELWAKWAAQYIPHMHGGSFGQCATIGVVSNDGQPVGCVVFTMHMPETRNIQISFASDRRNWLTRRLMTAILRYPFRQLGVQRLTALVPPSATNATQFLIKMGWRREGCIRLGFGNEDAVVWGLLESEWRWSRFNADRLVTTRVSTSRAAGRGRRRRRGGRVHAPAPSLRAGLSECDAPAHP